MDGGFLHLSQWKPVRATNWVVPRFSPGESPMHAAKSHQQYPSIAVLELRRESTVDFSASPANVTRTPITIMPACDQSDQSASPSRPRKARKAGGSAKKIRKKATRPIEYIQVPKHWFSHPLHQSMKTVVRPPTKVSSPKVDVVLAHDRRACAAVARWESRARRRERRGLGGAERGRG